MEILSIRLENIDLARQIIYVPNAKAGTRERPITEGTTYYRTIDKFSKELY